MNDYYSKYLKYKNKYIKLKELSGGYILPPLDETNISEIAIVCHCSPQYQSEFPELHRQLYYLNIKNQKKIREIDDSIKYIDIDPKCKNDKWTEITKESLMYIWGINCNIYLSYENYYSSLILDNILENSYDKLKLNGKVFFSVAQSYEYEKNTKYLKKKYLDNKEFPGFTFEKVSIDNFPYIIGDKEELKNKEYYVFTKYLE
jgi:hypothetical protein